jgi:hypothetical protein
MTIDGWRLGPPLFAAVPETGRKSATIRWSATADNLFGGCFGDEFSCALGDHQRLAAFRALDLPADQQFFADPQRR